MRICVFGAGAIGGLIAGRLAIAGEDVTVIGRGPQIDAIKALGIELLWQDGRAETARVKAVETAALAGEQDPTDAREDLLAERILSPAERDDHAIDTIQRLSIKEAAYKAIVALTAKHLPLREICVDPAGDGGFQLRVPQAEMRVEASSSCIQGHYLSLARAFHADSVCAGLRR